MRFRGVTFDSTRGHRATRIESVFDVAWNHTEISAHLQTFDAKTKESQQLWSAAKYREGFRRCLAGIEAMYCAVLDCDSADVGSMDQTCQYLQRLGLAHIVYSTWNHANPEKQYKGLFPGPFDCFRVVLPYSRPVTPTEHTAIVEGLFGYELPENPPKYLLEVAGRFLVSSDGRERAVPPRGWDPVSSRPAQGYFLPSSRSTIHIREGVPLDVERILARPTTPRLSARRQRTYSSPCRVGLGAARAIEEALAKRGVALGPETPAGWRRAPCPACAPSGIQRSPSLTVRANGDGVDLRCHDRCRRSEILGSLSLTPGDFVPPSELRLAFEDQLERQAVSHPPLPLSAVSECLERDMRRALAEKVATVLQYPPGVGKSFTAARVIADLVRKGLKVAYVTQEHVVAAETLELLPPEIRVRSVHLHSPLVIVKDSAQCLRLEELKEQVFEYGTSLLGKICPRCPLQSECEAYAQAKTRHTGRDSADVIFTSHAGISQVFGSDRGDDTLLIVDEMPGVYESVSADIETTKKIAQGAIAPSADPYTYGIAVAIAKGWEKNQPPGEVVVMDKSIGWVSELITDHPRLRLREGASPRQDEKPLLETADALIRLCSFSAQGGRVFSFSALIPSAAHIELVRRRGVLLSATPMLPALPDFQVRRVDVRDSAPVRRVMILVGGRGSKALTSTYFDPIEGKYVQRSARNEGLIGVNWGVVDSALSRALTESEKYPDRRVLFVTFKPVADALRASPERLVGGRVTVGHFGALRGKNFWMEGRELESSVIYLLGSPRQNMLPTINQLGLYGDAADQAWVDHAAGELTQAEGRLRLPRRTKPCTVICEGDVCPLGWHAGNINELIELSVL